MVKLLLLLLLEHRLLGCANNKLGEMDHPVGELVLPDVEVKLEGLEEVHLKTIELGEPEASQDAPGLIGVGVVLQVL